MKRKFLRRITAINKNKTKIKYICVLDKIYEVEKLSFYDFTIIAREIDKSITDVPTDEIFDFSDFPEFKITLHNWHGKVINMTKYLNNTKSEL